MHPNVRHNFARLGCAAGDGRGDDLSGTRENRSRRKVLPRGGLIELPPVDGSVGTEERVEGTKSLNDAYDEVRMRDGTAANELARLRSR